MLFLMYGIHSCDKSVLKNDRRDKDTDSLFSLWRRGAWITTHLVSFLSALCLFYESFIIFEVLAFIVRSFKLSFID